MHLDGRNSRRDYQGFKQTIGWGALVAIGFGLVWMAIVHLAPKKAPLIALVLAAILLLALGILLFIATHALWSKYPWIKIFLGVVCILLFFLLIAMIVMYRNQMKFQGLCLDYAVRFLNENPFVFGFIPLFMLLTLGLVALITWQHCCFISQSKSYFWNFANNGIWGVLNILEFIWGFQFLRDAFNFCVSGCATDWYYHKKPGCGTVCKRFLCKHWGSVVGGSFLNAFFSLPTLVAQVFICHPEACCAKCGAICFNKCNCCTCFFDLIRTDAYSYMNLTGIPFCNSARSCQKICSDSRHFVGSHSPMSMYRFAAHVLAVSLVALLTYFILKYRVDNFGFWHLAIGIALILTCVTYFIKIHSDSAEGIQTSFLVERNTDDYPFMQYCRPSYRDEFARIEASRARDGFC